MNNIKRTDVIVTRCRQCDELLLDGDTAYKLCGEYFCPECVSDSLVVCREEDEYDYELLKQRQHHGKDD